MTGTIPRSPARTRPKALAPMIREVCLVGSPGRAYIHITPQGLRSEDPGLKKPQEVGMA